MLRGFFFIIFPLIKLVLSSIIDIFLFFYKHVEVNGTLIYYKYVYDCNYYEK